MKIKKILAMIIATLAISATFVACTNNEESNGNQSTPSTESVENNTDEPDISPDEDIPDIEGDADSEEFKETLETYEGYIIPELESENPLASYAQAGLNVGVWGGAMAEFPSESVVDIVGIDPSNYVNSIVVMNQMSTPMNEIIILEAKDGEVDAALQVLKDRVEAKLAEGMMYPDTLVMYNNAAFVTEGNYAIYVASFAPTSASKAIVEAIKG